MAGQWDRPQQGSIIIEAFHLESVPITPLPVPDVHFALLMPEQQRILATAMREDVEEVRLRLSRGERAALALVGEVVAGYGWISYDAVRSYEPPLEIPLPSGHAYIWDCATVAAYRGRGIFAGLLRFMLAELQREGLTQIWAAVARGNVPSSRAFARAGFRVVAESTMAGGGMKLRPTNQALPEEAAVLGHMETAL